MKHSDIAYLGRERSVLRIDEAGRRKLTAISARVAVWGVITGLGSMALGAFSPAVTLVLTGVGFIAGGVGSIATSILVVKDLSRAPWPLKLAAFMGIPFGACLITFSAGAIFQLPFFPIWTALSVPLGAICGVILMVLLVTGFLSHAFSKPTSRWDE